MSSCISMLTHIAQCKGGHSVAVYEILKVGEDVLREKARHVPQITPNIIKLLDNMKDTMYQADGVGLAAPQIGISKRVIIVDAGDGLIELVNPEIIETLGEETDLEGCLSIPGVNENVTRAFQVKAKGLDRNGMEIIVQGEGLLARALQHEVDHLEGVLFIDKVSKGK